MIDQSVSPLATVWAAAWRVAPVVPVVPVPVVVTGVFVVVLWLAVGDGGLLPAGVPVVPVVARTLPDGLPEVAGGVLLVDALLAVGVAVGLVEPDVPVPALGELGWVAGLVVAVVTSAVFLCVVRVAWVITNGITRAAIRSAPHHA